MKKEVRCALRADLLGGVFGRRWGREVGREVEGGVDFDEAGNDGGEAFRDGFPYAGIVDAFVFVDDEVAHADDGAPGDAGVGGLEVVIQGTHGFADDGQAVQGGVRFIDVGKEFGGGKAGNPSLDGGGLLEDVVDALGVPVDAVRHRATMSFRAL